jgi:hypothetical protein
MQDSLLPFVSVNAIFPFREVIITLYRFFYRVKDKTVWIVAVWHGAQLPRQPDETENE